MNRRPTLPALFPVLLIVAITNTACENGKRPSDAAGTSKAPTIQVIAAESATMDRTADLAASIEGYEAAELLSRIDGHVGTVDVNIGDHVTKGQVLATLNVPELADAVQQKQEVIKQYEADVQSKLAEVELAGEQLKSLEAVRDEKKQEYGRFAALVEKGSLNQKRLDQSAFALKAAEAGVRTGRLQIKAAEAHVASAKAMRNVAAADLKMAETMAGYREIRAPFDGLITMRSVDPGAFVRPATSGAGTAMFRIARVDKLRVVFHVPMEMSRHVDKGDAAVLHDVAAIRKQRIDKIGDQPLAISRFSSALDLRSRMMRAEIDVDNQALRREIGKSLMPGDYGQVTLTLELLAGKPMVPKSAIGTENGQQFILKLGDNNTFIRVNVDEIMAEDGKLVVIDAEGIKANDRVAVSAKSKPPLNESLDDSRIEDITPSKQ